MGCETANSNKASVSVPVTDSDEFDLVICMSGKRKSGKDYVAIKLAEALLTGGGGNMRVAICGISHPLKEEYAKLHGLDVEKLKSDSEYKELHRAEMVQYGERIRAACPGYFCRKALMEGARQITAKANATIDKVNSTASSTLQILIVTDCRRPTDLDYFRAHQTLAHHHVIFIRVNASRTARESRGYRFAAGIDDAETECALDEFAGWSYDLNNDGDTEELARSFAEISNKLSNINALP